MKNTHTSASFLALEKTKKNATHMRVAQDAATQLVADESFFFDGIDESFFLAYIVPYPLVSWDWNTI